MILTNFAQVNIMSLGFLLLFTAYGTCQNFSAKILKDEGIGNTGFYSVAILYLVFAIFSFFGTAIVNKINNMRVSLSCGGLCYIFWVLSFILPSKQEYLSKTLIEVAILVAASINGFGAAILWVS